MSWRDTLKVTTAEAGMLIFDDCQYESLRDLIQVGIFGLCACGHPCDNVELVGDALRLLQWRQENLGLPFAEWYAEWQAKELATFGSQRAADFVWYWLDSKDFTEHGSSIPGWPTDKGAAVLEAIDEWIALDEDRP